MAKKYKYKNNKSNKGLVAGIVVISLVLVALVVTLCCLCINDDSNGDDVVESYERDDTSLYLGTFVYSEDSESGYEFANNLYLNIYENGELYASHVFTASDFMHDSDFGFDLELSFSDLRWSYGDVGLVDVSSLVPSQAQEYGISFWTSLDEGNYFEVLTEWTAGPLLSQPVTFVDSGIYVFGIPTSDGAVIDYSHADIWIHTLIEGGDD